MNKRQILALVKGSVNELNEELDYANLTDITWETALAGGEDGLDSLSLVRLIVGLEGEIERALDRKISLADENALSVRHSPFRTVNSLVDFILAKLGEPHA
jgi:acyl carrier protein